MNIDTLDQFERDLKWQSIVKLLCQRYMHILILFPQ